MLEKTFFVYLSFKGNFFLFFVPPPFLARCLSVYLSLFVCLFFCLSVCLFFCFSVILSVCLYFFCFSVCIFLSIYRCFMESLSLFIQNFQKIRIKKFFFRIQIHTKFVIEQIDQKSSSTIIRENIYNMNNHTLIFELCIIIYDNQYKHTIILDQI